MSAIFCIFLKYFMTKFKDFFYPAYIDCDFGIPIYRVIFSDSSPSSVK